MKDSFGEPEPSGWRCVYFSLRHVPSGLVGELQVTFTKVKAINGRSHRIYNLVRCLEHGVEPAPRNKVVAEQRHKAARAAQEQERRHEVEAAAEAGEKLCAAEARAAAAEGIEEEKRSCAAAAAKSYTEGLARRDEKKWPEAIAAFRKCVELDPNHSKAWYQLGYAYWGQNMWCEASYEPWTRCIALDPTHATAHNNLGNVLQFVRKDYDGAEKMYRKAIELDPSSAAAHNNLGDILVRNDRAGAKKMYRKAILLRSALKATRLP